MKPFVLPAGCLALLFALGGALQTSRADPGEHVSSAADQEQLNVTIYNGGLSLVHDRRHVVLGAGPSTIAWRDVSGNMTATSAILEDRTAPGTTNVLEQNFNYDLLRPATLLEKYVGRSVTVVHDKPVAGHPASEAATLLSNNDGVVLRYSDRIETGLYDSHIVFPAIPENLRDRPTLVLELQSAKGGTHELELSYLTGNLSWSADYVGIVSANEQHMDVSGLVTLANGTGTTYANAKLQLVAGNVNVYRPTETMDTYATGRRLAVPAPPPAEPPDDDCERPDETSEAARREERRDLQDPRVAGLRFVLRESQRGSRAKAPSRRVRHV